LWIRKIEWEEYWDEWTYLGDDDIDLLDWELDIFEFTL
jgi:hypothetical protein